MNFFGKWLKDFRMENGMTGSTLGKRLGGKSQAFIAKLESGDKRPSEELLEDLFNEFKLSQATKDKVKEYVALDKSPELIQKKYTKLIKESERKIISGEAAEVSTKEFEFKVYELDTENDGFVDLEKFEILTEERNVDLGKQLQDECIILRTKGDKSDPFFFNGDIIAFLKKEFQNWQAHNNKVVLVEIDGKLFVKKVTFEKGEPFLHTFDDDLYPILKVSELESVKYIASPKYRLNINLNNTSL